MAVNVRFSTMSVDTMSIILPTIPSSATGALLGEELANLVYMANRIRDMACPHRHPTTSIHHHRQLEALGSNIRHKIEKAPPLEVSATTIDLVLHSRQNRSSSTLLAGPEDMETCQMCLDVIKLATRHKARVSAISKPASRVAARTLFADSRTPRQLEVRVPLLVRVQALQPTLCRIKRGFRHLKVKVSKALAGIRLT